ncbi:energy-coupling factor transporter transmembrane protein EcfT [Rhizobium sp.]|jgi:biotin transport system permease protein|uniref:energy-coupling factor transporter transmembrane component T family protein n=1 Tax=Rhizobium sp. TaxID=391 RepID=UPI000E852280|nr:transporter [Rhizobium sp.]
MLTSLYVDGNTIFHRMPVMIKLALLAGVGIALALTSSVTVQALATVACGAIYLCVGLSLKSAFARIRPVVITIAIFAVINAFVLTPLEALVNTLRLLAVVFLAATITATTTIHAFMAALTVLLTPLEKLGVLKASDVSLAVGLVLRFVPDIANRYQALKEAHVARGLTVRPLKMIGPLIILTLKDADSIADAIDARGIRGH